MHSMLVIFGTGFLCGVIVYDIVQGELTLWRARRRLRRYDRDNRPWYDL